MLCSSFQPSRLIVSIREIERRLNSCHHSVMATVETMLVLVLLREGATVYICISVCCQTGPTLKHSMIKTCRIT